MYNKLSLVAACLATIAYTAAANASNTTDPKSEEVKADSRIQVEWVNPKSYTDLKDRNFSSERFRKHVFSIFEEHLAELAANLPEGQRLQFKITDIDLAGRVEPGSFSGLLATHDDIRIMRNIDIPRMKFEYSLVDAKGDVLKHEVVKLKDMNYLNRMRGIGSNRAYVYEKRMLTRWFEDNFKNT